GNLLSECGPAIARRARSVNARDLLSDGAAHAAAASRSSCKSARSRADRTQGKKSAEGTQPRRGAFDKSAQKDRQEPRARSEERHVETASVRAVHPVRHADRSRPRRRGGRGEEAGAPEGARRLRSLGLVPPQRGRPREG